LLKSFANRRLPARLESFNHHVEHGPSLYQAGRGHGATILKILKRRVSTAGGVTVGLSRHGSVTAGLSRHGSVTAGLSRHPSGCVCNNDGGVKPPLHCAPAGALPPECHGRPAHGRFHSYLLTFALCLLVCLCLYAVG
jgi:hypothetical protein